LHKHMWYNALEQLVLTTCVYSVFTLQCVWSMPLMDATRMFAISEIAMAKDTRFARTAATGSLGTTAASAPLGVEPPERGRSSHGSGRVLLLLARGNGGTRQKGMAHGSSRRSTASFPIVSRFRQQCRHRPLTPLLECLIF
jgi:hypothetical protein